jgi:hypothetical protein
MFVAKNVISPTESGGRIRLLLFMKMPFFLHSRVVIINFIYYYLTIFSTNPISGNISEL